MSALISLGSCSGNRWVVRCVDDPHLTRGRRTPSKAIHKQEWPRTLQENTSARTKLCCYVRTLTLHYLLINPLNSMCVAVNTHRNNGPTRLEEQAVRCDHEIETAGVRRTQRARAPVSVETVPYQPSGRDLHRRKRKKMESSSVQKKYQAFRRRRIRSCQQTKAKQKNTGLGELNHGKRGKRKTHLTTPRRLLSMQHKTNLLSIEHSPGTPTSLPGGHQTK